jgi:hypothetical protein
MFCLPPQYLHVLTKHAYCTQEELLNTKTFGKLKLDNNILLTIEELGRWGRGVSQWDGGVMDKKKNSTVNLL